MHLERARVVSSFRRRSRDQRTIPAPGNGLVGGSDSPEKSQGDVESDHR
jgi:hypothetical protein